MAMARTHIICFGNELHGDDGIGPAIHAELLKRQLPPEVRIFRADVSGLAAVHCFEQCDQAIVVDAVQGFGQAGSIHILQAEDIAEESTLSIHGHGVGNLLALLPHLIDHPPRVKIIGIELSETRAFANRLSPPVARAIAPATERVLEAAR